jgi:hypothetical protein
MARHCDPYGEICVWFWWGKLKETTLMEDLHKDGRIILKWILKTQDGRTWSGLVWTNMETSGRLL